MERSTFTVDRRGLQGFYMFGYQFDDNSNKMRTVIVVHWGGAEKHASLPKSTTGTTPT